MTTTSNHRPLFFLGYGVALVLLIGPTLDFVVATYPWSPDLISWRFGALGLLGNALILPTIAVGIVTITAGVLDHRRMLRVVSVLTLIVSLLLLAGLAMLMLDALQLRRNIRPDVRPGFDFGALRVMVNYLLAVSLGLWVAFSAWNTSRSRAATKRGRVRDDKLIGTGRVAVQG